MLQQKSVARIVKTKYEWKCSIRTWTKSRCGHTVFNKTEALFNSSVYAVILVCVSLKLHIAVSKRQPHSQTLPAPAFPYCKQIMESWTGPAIQTVCSCVPRPRPAFHGLQYVGETRSKATWSVHYYNVKPTLAALHCLLRLILVLYIPLWFY